jgi:hypothetical protein
LSPKTNDLTERKVELPMCGVGRCLPERRKSASRREPAAPDNDTEDNAGVGRVSSVEVKVYGPSDLEKYESVLETVGSSLNRLRLNLEVSGDAAALSV